MFTATKIATILVHFSSVLAAPRMMLESLWQNGSECQGPPSRIQTFATADPSQTKRNGLENWSDAYALASPVYPFGRCGNLPVNANVSCCYNFESLNITAGYKSMAAMEIFDQTVPENVFPLSSKSNSYCHIQSTDMYLGYPKIWVLANGNCAKGTFDYDFSFKCNSTQLTIYDNTNCTTMPVSFAISANVTEIEDETYGLFNIQLMTIDQPSLKFGWVATLPGSMLVPLHQNAWEIVAIILYVFEILGTFVVIGFALNRYRITKKNQMILLSLSQVWWLLYVIFRIVNVYYNYGVGSREFLIVQFALMVTNSIATLFTILYTARFFQETMKLEGNSVRGMYAVILLLYVGLCGSIYLYTAFFNIPASSPAYKGWFDVFQRWSKAVDYWTILMFVWNVLPMIYVAWALLRKPGASVFDTIMLSFTVDIIYTLILVGQVLVIVWFFIVGSLMEYSTVLGSDRSLLSFASFRQFCVVLHSILNCCLIERLKALLRKATSKATSSGVTAASGQSKSSHQPISPKSHR